MPSNYIHGINFYGLPQDDTIRYKDGMRKEVADWRRGLVVGIRKLYDKRGVLQEEHIFDPSDAGTGRGTIKTYYSDGSIASVLHVRQSVEDNVYCIEILPEKVVGYYRAITVDKKYIDENKKEVVEKIVLKDVKSYEYTLQVPLKLDYQKNYEKFNTIYDDPILLYKNRKVSGLKANVTYFDPYGLRISDSELQDGNQNGIYKTYWKNNQVKSEGRLIQVIGGSKPVGNWKYYYPNGVLQSEVNYYEPKDTIGVNVDEESFIPYGTAVDSAVYYFEDGKIQTKILNPSISDAYLRIDTVFLAYKSRNVRFTYNDDQKILIYKTALGKFETFEFSGLYKEYYDSAGLKKVGYLSKPSRRLLNAQEIKEPENKFVTMKGDKKIGKWYFFTKDGELKDVIDYRLSGLPKEKQPTKRQKEKDFSDYKKIGEDFWKTIEIQDSN